MTFENRKRERMWREITPYTVRVNWDTISFLIIIRMACNLKHLAFIFEEFDLNPIFEFTKVKQFLFMCACWLLVQLKIFD